MKWVGRGEEGGVQDGGFAGTSGPRSGQERARTERGIPSIESIPT